jgi:hypothetical protein
VISELSAFSCHAHLSVLFEAFRRTVFSTQNQDLIMNRVPIVAIFTLMLTCPGLAQSLASNRAEDLKKDLERMQGKWTRSTVENAEPTTITKVIEGHKETFTTVQDGKVVYAQEVEFELVAAGPVRLFTFENAVITAGPNKGKPNPTNPRGAYIYRFYNDRWYQINGVLDDDREVFKGKEPRLVVWDQVKP